MSTPIVNVLVWLFANIFLPNLDSMRHTEFPQPHQFRNTLMRAGQFYNFIILTIIMPLEHVLVIPRRALQEIARARKIYAPL